MVSFTSMNQDDNELQKFNAASADWWNPNGSFRPLHDMNPLRLSWINNLIDLNQKKILDIGCGGGIFAEALAKQGALVTAIDLAENAIMIAKQHAIASNLKIDYQCRSVEALAKEYSNTFDIITCMELLEHVPSPESIIRACAHLLKPGGYAVFATLNRNLKALFHAIIGAEYILNLLPPGTHDFNKFITPAELCKIARHHKLSIEAITGITCDLSARYFHLTTDARVNYMIACIKD